jgi:DMSO/TMAO reductase YedYZ molybdopterin-dependent catalytic subunit
MRRESYLRRGDSLVRSMPPRLPPGQSPTRKFPVVGERAPSLEGTNLERWRLTVDGLVARRLELAWPEYQALPKAEREIDVHCVTGWSRLASRIGGVPLAQVLDVAEPEPAARFVRFEAYSPRHHDTSLPLELARADTWLVDTFDGAPLAPEHGFPLRTVTPSRYFYKSLKWLKRIELLAEDRLGFWERDSAYHNVADPWPGDQRFTSGSIDPDELVRLFAGADLAPWRLPKKVVQGVDLRGWHPRDRNLARLQLKNCDLRHADLARCDLRQANLSLSDLRGANLAGADLAGADLEGARFAGADLSGADLSRTALSATRFFEDAAGSRVPANVSGARFDGASGLLEDQESFLRQRGLLPGPSAGE